LYRITRVLREGTTVATVAERVQKGKKAADNRLEKETNRSSQPKKSM